MSIALMALRYLWPVLVLGGAYLWADEGWHNAVAHRAEVRATAAEAKLAELDRQAIAQRERWTQLTTAEETRAKTQEIDRKRRFDALKRRAATDRPTVPSDGTKRLLGDAYEAAKPAEAPAVPAGAPAANPAPTGIEEWGVRMYEWAAICYDRVNAWSNWYNSLRTE